MDENPTSQLIKLINHSSEMTRSLDDLIKTIRGNVMISIGWTGGLVLLGAVMTLVFYSVGHFQSMMELVKIGPMLLGSSLSAFQVKSIMVARERLFSYRCLRGRLDRCHGLPETQIEALIAESIKALDELRKRE